MKIPNSTKDKSMLWGWPVEFWDLWGLRLLFGGALFGAFALAASLASSVILYKTAGITQSEADSRIAEAVAEIGKAQERTAELEKETARANEAAAAANERTAQAELRLARLSLPRRIRNPAEFRQALEGKPTARLQLMYLRGPSDGWFLAKELQTLMVRAGWEVGEPEAVATPDDPVDFDCSAHFA